MITEPKFHTTKDATWQNEAKENVPKSVLLKSDKVREKRSRQVYKIAADIMDRLEKLKELLDESTDEVMLQICQDKGTTPPEKGNFTWFNYDRSMKIEKQNQEPIRFDESQLILAKEKFMSFLKSNLTTQSEFIKKIIIDAFETRNGKLDTKRILNLLRYRSQIKDPEFRAAVDLIASAIRKPDSKTYYRLYTRGKSGLYSTMNLNFSKL